jgi:DnaJ-domain-containing protein 1
VPGWTSGIRIQPLQAIVQALEKPQAAALVASALQPAAGGPVSLARGYQRLAHAFGWSGAEARLVDRLSALTTLEEFFAEPGVAPERARAILAALLLLGLAQARPGAGQTVDSVPGVVVELADLAGVEVGAATPPPGRAGPGPTPPPVPARRSDPEEARRRRQRLLQRAMQNMGIGPLASRPEGAGGQAGDRHTPPPGQRPAVTAAEAELRRAFEATAPRARSPDLFARLGVEPTATREQVKQAYFTLAKQLHPDRFLAPALADLQPGVRDLFAALNEAYEALSDDRRRGELAARAAGGRPPGPSTSQAQQEAAGLDFQKGEACLRTRDLTRARGFYEAAVRAHPRAEYLAALAHVLAFDPKAPDRTRAAELLARALQDPGCDRAALTAAQLAREEGREEEAERLFRLAFQANPRNVEAEREVRLADLRRKRR